MRGRYISVKCLDVPSASQQLADHGRSCHRLADSWRIECKKAKELGQKPPLPPQQQKKLEARKAKKEGAEASGPMTAKGGSKGASAKDEPPVETDSSEDERNAAEVADAEIAEGKAGAAGEPPPSDKDRVTAAEQMAAIRAEDAQPNRPSFLAV